jgi:hypothetical protein
MNWVARGMQSAAISTVTKMAQMAQKHAGDLLQQPLLGMLSWAGLGCLPGNWLSTSSGACKGPSRLYTRHSGTEEQWGDAQA